jgi:guanyl-specific ribonuclease Sa
MNNEENTHITEEDAIRIGEAQGYKFEDSFYVAEVGDTDFADNGEYFDNYEEADALAKEKGDKYTTYTVRTSTKTEPEEDEKRVYQELVS